MTDDGGDRSVEISFAGAVDDEINGRTRVARTESRMWSVARHYRYEIVSSISASLFGWYVLWQGTLGPPITWPDSQLYENIAAHPIWSSAFWEGQ